MRRLQIPASAAKSGVESAVCPERVLVSVIDDDESFRLALVASLSSLGYRIRGFASADEFIAEDRAGCYDCIITDIHMPGIGGFDLKRLLAARGSTVPVIMITARGEQGLESKAAASGAVCLLRKPFETDALIDCLERATKHWPLIH
jgi:FixJ family two-component response regulator